MYEEFYNLLRKPFSLTPDPSCLFLGRQHAEALAALQYSLLTNAGLTVLTAEAGLGKTLLINRMKTNIDSQVRIGTISNTHPDFSSILPWVAAAFELSCDMTDPTSMHGALEEFLAEQFDVGNRVVLVIDEAHNLSRSAFEEIRLLNNLNQSEGSGLQIVMVGQPILLDILKADSLKELSQRVAVDYSLSPLGYEATDDYITYRLALCGGAADIFDYVSRAAIYFHSRGIPRLINGICDLSMVYGYGDSLEAIDYRVIKKVLLSRKVSTNYFHRLGQSKDAENLKAAIFATHGVDIARFEVV